MPRANDVLHITSCVLRTTFFSDGLGQPETIQSGRKFSLPRLLRRPRSTHIRYRPSHQWGTRQATLQKANNKQQTVVDTRSGSAAARTPAPAATTRVSKSRRSLAATARVSKPEGVWCLPMLACLSCIYTHASIDNTYMHACIHTYIHT